MTELRCAFDPAQQSAIQDLFADGFHAATRVVCNEGGEPVTARSALPSGAATDQEEEPQLELWRDKPGRRIKCALPE